MDFFALVGGTSNTVYRIELEQQLQRELGDLFSSYAEEFLNPELEVVPFERENFHPDATEVLQISPFDLPELLYDPTQNVVGWPALPLDEDTISRIFCVFAYDAEADRLIFQVITKQQRLIQSGWTIILGQNSFKRLDSSGLSLGSGCHAVYEENSLRFKSIWWLKQFIDISSYYRAATVADVDQFAALDNVKIENLQSLKERSGQWVRTRLAYILDSGVLSSCGPADLASKANEFGVALTVVDEGGTPKLLIPQKPKELRAVLKFLEEEYYAGPITGAAYEANSKRRKQP